MKKILIILFSLLFTFQVANADNLNQKKVFCENESEDFFIEFIENKMVSGHEFCAVFFGLPIVLAIYPVAWGQCNAG